MVLPWTKKKGFSPLPEANDYVKEAAPFFRQFVLLVCTPICSGHNLKDSIRHKRMKAGSEHAFGKSEVSLEFAESLHSIKRVAKNQQRPAVSYDLK